ncbi:hypothetical protein Q8A64_17295 [Oxalobacteraceae bacterium R-40]|uniref:Zinc-or iron-chelating protein n=1 Tax=Keguizhuia sedimenti TaxID=3064264 RepID=A0ABU1BUP4_9BURK|nr:hypothetical protein [Oxalobacteraceae bacterium R-40]
MEPDTPCHFVRHGGCSIYEERPEEPCRRFECAWKETTSPFPEAFRPDRVGIIILRIKWRNRNAYRLVSAGHDLSLEVLAWMRAWSQHTGYPFFYEEAGETLGYGPKAFLDDMQQRQARGEPLW